VSVLSTAELTRRFGPVTALDRLAADLNWAATAMGITLRGLVVGQDNLRRRPPSRASSAAASTGTPAGFGSMPSARLGSNRSIELLRPTR